MGHESPGIASDRKKRIFLSYGRDEYVADADRIHKDLAERGHDVWFDLERVYAGRDWEAAIERGLRECDLMVLLMTPHSVRRRDARDPTSTDGYCLNEIAAALRRNKLIIPVLLVSLEPDASPTQSIAFSTSTSAMASRSGSGRTSTRSGSKGSFAPSNGGSWTIRAARPASSPS